MIAVLHLLGRSSPPNVPDLIMPVGVDPIKREVRVGLFPDVQNKLLERIEAKFDAARAIPLEVDVVWIDAPASCVLVGHVLRGPFSPCSVAVFNLHVEISGGLHVPAVSRLPENARASCEEHSAEIREFNRVPVRGHHRVPRPNLPACL